MIQSPGDEERLAPGQWISWQRANRFRCGGELPGRLLIGLRYSVLLEAVGLDGLVVDQDFAGVPR
jgi:hypothetical protein